MEASRLTGEQLTDYLEREGVSLAVLEQWPLSLDEAAPRATMKRIRELEDKLARTEANLLVTRGQRVDTEIAASGDLCVGFESE